MKKTGIFGGTFNPPHLGHRRIACGFADQLGLDRVLIIPSFIPPHKEPAQLASAEDRLALCRRTFDRPDMEICPAEINRRGTSYTYDTLRDLHETCEDELYFLVGDDMLLYFDKWRNPDGILRLCRVVAAVRSDRTSVEELKQYARAHFPQEYRDGRFLFLELPPLEVSSTEIRKKIGTGASLQGLVTPAAEQYILRKGLYL